MVDETPSVEQRDRLRPQILPPLRPHRHHRHGGIALGEDGAGHLAPLVHLDHKGVGLQPVVERQRRRRPGLGRGAAQARIRQHVGALPLPPGGDDPAGIGPRPGTRGRVHRHDDPRQGRCRREASRLDPSSGP